MAVLGRMMAIGNKLRSNRAKLGRLIELFELQQGATLFSVRFMTLAFGLLQSMMLARWMSVGDFGTSGAISITYALIAGIGGFGIEFFVFGGLGGGRPAWALGVTRRYFREVTRIRTLTSLIFALGGVLWFLWRRYQGDVSLRQLGPGVLGVIMFCFGSSVVDFFRNVAQVQGRYRLLAWHYFIFECILRFLPILAYSRFGISWFWALNGLVSIGAWVHLRDQLSDMRGGRPLRGRSSVYRRCLWQGGIGILRFGYLRGDEAICMSFAGNEAFALFLVAKRLSTLVQTVCDMLIAHSWGRVFHGAAESPVDLSRRVRVFTWFTLISVVPVCIVFAVARTLLVDLYSGGKYPGAAEFVPWLSLGIATYFLSVPFSTFLQARRRFAAVFLISALHSGIVLAISWWMLHFGHFRFLGVAQVAGGIGVLVAAHLITRRYLYPRAR